jgi:predicted lipid-binding transport protein (Tim44 family)
MRGPAKLASYIGLLMVLGGFALIGLAWNGAAGLGYLPAQFPFLLSGGVAGLGLIGGGAGVLFVQAQREIDAIEAAQTDRVIQGLRQTSIALRGGSPAPAAVVTAPARRGAPAAPVRPAAEDPTIVSEEHWAPQAAEALVVAGRSSFHDPSCHLVSTRDDLDLMGRDEALSAGLKPCRVCKP